MKSNSNKFPTHKAAYPDRNQTGKMYPYEVLIDSRNEISFTFGVLQKVEEQGEKDNQWMRETSDQLINFLCRLWALHGGWVDWATKDSNKHD